MSNTVYSPEEQRVRLDCIEFLYRAGHDPIANPKPFKQKLEQFWALVSGGPVEGEGGDAAPEETGASDGEEANPGNPDGKKAK